jgi:hypothetical protein
MDELNDMFVGSTAHDNYTYNNNINFLCPESS